jgi:hypothetical protein
MQVPPNVAEARAWIANWKATQAGGSSSKPAAATAPAAAAAPAPPAVKPSSSSTSTSSNGDVPANVAEARQWIANWKAQQQGGSSGGSDDGNAAAAAAAEESAAAAEGDVQVVEQGNIFASVGKLFGGWGQGQK